MLFPYTYVSHPLEKLHAWIEHTLINVWCRNTGRFETGLLCKDLQGIAEELHNIDSEKKTIIDEIRDMDTQIQTLPISKRRELVTMFQNSTAVDALCENRTGSIPSGLRELLTWEPKTGIELSRFFKRLFTDHIKAGPIKRKLGDLKSHFDHFTDRSYNGEDMCPFCGLTDLRNSNYNTREAYDHYLPKYRYPFNSVNFRNLAPMCHTCNSSYKTTKDPLSRRKGHRQKAFTPFDPNAHFPEVNIPGASSRLRRLPKRQRGIGNALPVKESTIDQLNMKRPKKAEASFGVLDPKGISTRIDPSKIEKLEPDDIQIEVTSPMHQEEFDTWTWLFGIEERYKGKLSQKRGAKHWLTNIVEAKDPQSYLEDIRAIAERDPLSDDSFLKKAVLENFKQSGLLDFD